MTLPIIHSDIAPHAHGVEISPFIIGGVIAMAVIAAFIVRRLRKA